MRNMSIKLDNDVTVTPTMTVGHFGFLFCRAGERRDELFTYTDKLNVLVSVKKLLLLVFTHSLMYNMAYMLRNVNSARGNLSRSSLFDVYRGGICFRAA